MVEYLRNYVRHWTTDFAAVARYYVAMKKRMDGDKAAAIQMLLECHNHAAFDRFAAALVSLTMMTLP